MRVKKFLLGILIVSMVSLSIIVSAKTLDLLDQPNNNANIVGKVDLSSGIIPIYSPKEGGWIKIADPKNGNVGWVKSTDLKNAGFSQSTFSFSTVNDGKAPVTFKIIQFGEPTSLTPEQNKALVKKMQSEQQEMQRTMQNMMNEMNKMFNNNWHFMNDHFPMMPIVILPVQKNINETSTSDKPVATHLEPVKQTK